MSQIILHIGPHKTGTTTIQDFLSSNRDALLARGFDFPVLGRTPAGAQAHRHFSACMRGIEAEIPEGFESVAAAWRPEAGTGILSSEDFYYGSTAEGIARLARLVPGITRVILCLRDPVSHLISHHAESLKGLSPKGLSEFSATYAAQLDRPKNGFSYYRYEENIARWRNIAPVETIPLDGTQDLLTRFLQLCGMTDDVIGDLCTASPQSNRNVSASPAISAARLLLNRGLENGLIAPGRHKVLKKKLADFPGPRIEALSGGALRPVDVDLSLFAEGFLRHNPGLSHLLSGIAPFARTHELPIDAIQPLVAELEQRT